MAKRTGTRLPRFLSLDHVMKWLRGNPDAQKDLGELCREWLWETPAGRELLDRTVAERMSNRVPLLVVVGTFLGEFVPHVTVECYTTTDVDVKWIQKPHATKFDTELSLEEYVEHQVGRLPVKYRGLYWPHAMPGRPGLRGSCTVKRVTVDELLDSKVTLELIRELKAQAELGKKVLA